jgi:spermidine synthase
MRDARIVEVIVCVSGGVLLSLEIVASRVLAPYFGASTYVWGSLISVFLCALSVGYLAGGRLADRSPSLETFAGIVFVAGLLTVPVPWVAAPLLEAIAFVDFGPKLNPLLGAILLFVLPSIVMGMVSPFAVRLRARAVTTMGATAGSLYATSTIGSIAGTLATSFVLIDHLGVRALITSMGFTLVALGVIGWVMARRLRLAGKAAGVAAIIALGLAGAAALKKPSTLQHVRDTAYHRITVSDEGSVRYLALDDYRQSALDRRAPSRTIYHYVDYMHLPLVFCPGARRMTQLGLGGGTVPARYARDHAAMVVDAVEIDPEVARVAHDYFGLAESERLHVHTGDGRLRLLLARDTSDIILLDAYQKDALPFHLATRELFTLVRARLAPGGVVAANVIGALDGSGSRLFRAVYRTIRSVFQTVYVFPVDLDTDGTLASRRNIIVVATDDPQLEAAEIRRRAAALIEQGSVTVEQFRAAASSLYAYSIRTDDVPILTDDFAPVDGLISQR